MLRATLFLGVLVAQLKSIHSYHSLNFTAMALHTRLLKYTIAFLLLAALIWLTAWQQHPARKKVLVFSKTKGWHHTSIPNGIAAIQKLGRENGFDVDTTTDATWFNDNTLKKYAAVVFLNTTGDVLNNEQQAAFEHYIHHGGGFVGVHSATDTEY